MKKFVSVDEKLEIAMTALEDIMDPIAAIKRDMQPGYELVGQMAVALSNNPDHLKSIAREALYKINTR